MTKHILGQAFHMPSSKLMISCGSGGYLRLRLGEDAEKVWPAIGQQTHDGECVAS